MTSPPRERSRLLTHFRSLPRYLRIAFTLAPLAIIGWAWAFGAGVSEENGWVVARLVGPPPCDRPFEDGCHEATPHGPYNDPRECAQATADICLVPLGAADPALITELGTRYRAQYGLRVVVLPPISLPRTTFDSDRTQFDTRSLATLIQSTYPATRTETLLSIGLTPVDTYIPDIARWKFAFGALYPNDGLGATAVVSTHRMQSEDWAVWPSRINLVFRYGYDRTLLTDRAAKLATKYIGVATYRLPLDDNPESPLYNRILHVSDLDRMRDSLR